MSIQLSIQALSKRYKTGEGVSDINLDVAKGELVTLLGPSGCGKTTVLRSIGGFLEPDSGDIRIEGRSVVKLPPEKRPTTMVFQSYNLWPHMSVYENLAFGLKIRKKPKAEIREAVAGALRLVRLPGAEKKLPGQLSGGQQQRVALARSLLLQPAVLLLDEPFSALDAKLRHEMREELREIQAQTGLTMVFVTHDQEEALEVADRVIVMNQGRVEQAGPPDAVYNHPASPFVYGFLGSVNVFHGRLHEGALDAGGFALEAPEHAQAANARGVGFVRPHDIEIGRQGNGTAGILARLRRVHAIGPLAQLELERLDNAQLVEAVLSNERYEQLRLAPGETVVLQPKRSRVFVDHAA